MLHREIESAKRGALVALAALCVALAAPVRADEDAPGRVGRVADVGGELFLAPQDAPEQWVAIGLNYPVATGDNLWAGREGRAEIDFGIGQFRLAGDTSLHLSRLDERNVAVFVAQGRVIVRMRVLEPGDAARIDTPNTQVVLTRPGLYRIEVSEDRQHTQLAVREGEAMVDTGAFVQQVLPGQSAVADGATPQYVQVRGGVTTDGFDTWSADRDRYYERGPADAPVSRQMVGYADLDQYGAWESAPDYGAVWYPASVASDWAPYSNGYWTDVPVYGPTWVDYAPWGYAPFHYGRWAYIHGRWGWCPGGYVARPVWAPALVAWVGGPGWRHGGNRAGPVYGWVPLGWGEAYHPQWRGCSNSCWARYNKPYAVNLAERSDAPPTHYANWNAPGAVTAVPGAAFIGRKPVQANRVALSRDAMNSAPVLAAPQVRPQISQSPGVKPGSGVPMPASSFLATTNRPARPGTPAAATSASGVAIGAPAAARAAPGTARPAYAAPAALNAMPGNAVPAAKPAAVPIPQSVSTGTPAVQRTAPVFVNPPVAGNPAVPPAAVGARPRQPASQPVVVAPVSGQAGGAPPKPVLSHERTAFPPTLAPAPQPAPAAAAHPVQAAPAPHVAPAQPAAASAGRPGEAPKAEKPAAPHAAGEVPAK